MQNRNIYPYLVKEKASKKDGSYPIYIFIDIDNKRVATKSTGRKVHPDHWDPVGKCIADSVANARLMNAAIKKKIDELMGTKVTYSFIILPDASTAPAALLR